MKGWGREERSQEGVTSHWGIQNQNSKWPWKFETEAQMQCISGTKYASLPFSVHGAVHPILLKWPLSLFGKYTWDAGMMLGWQDRFWFLTLQKLSAYWGKQFQRKLQYSVEQYNRESTLSRRLSRQPFLPLSQSELVTSLTYFRISLSLPLSQKCSVIRLICLPYRLLILKGPGP